MGSDPVDPIEEIEQVEADDLPTEEQVAPAAAEAAPAELPWRGLHPLSLVVNLLPRTWRVVRGMWPLFLALLLQGRRDGASIVDLAILSVFFLSSVGGTVAHFLALRYRVAGGRLEIRTGLVSRQVRVIDPERIQNTELVRNVFHKLAGLVEVRLETASGTEVEGLLSALSEADGAELVAALGRSRRRPAEADAPRAILATAGPADLLRHGATGLRVGAGLAIAVGLGFEGLQWFGPERVGDVRTAVGAAGVALAVVAFASGLFVVAVGASMLRFWRFELARVGDRLVAVAGLLTRRSVELPLDKVQLVVVRQPILRRALGFGSVHVETAAARDEAGGTASAEAVVPVVDEEALGPLVQAVVAGEGDLWHRPLRPPHPLALRRGVIGAAVRGAILGALAAWWLWPWGLVAPPLLIAGGVASAWLDHRLQGWVLTEGALVARRGFVDRQTAIVSRRKVQAIEVRQGPLLRRWGLGQVVVRVAGSTVALPLVGEAEAAALLDALRPPRAA
jgi:putative membrane protein